MNTNIIDDTVTLSHMEYHMLKDARYWLFAVGLCLGAIVSTLLFVKGGC